MGFELKQVEELFPGKDFKIFFKNPKLEATFKTANANKIFSVRAAFCVDKDNEPVLDKASLDVVKMSDVMGMDESERQIYRTALMLGYLHRISDLTMPGEFLAASREATSSNGLVVHRLMASKHAITTMEGERNQTLREIRVDGYPTKTMQAVGRPVAEYIAGWSKSGAHLNSIQ